VVTDGKDILLSPEPDKHVGRTREKNEKGSQNPVSSTRGEKSPRKTTAIGRGDEDEAA